MPIVVTKLFVPPRVVRAVSRSHLVEQLNRSMLRKLTLLCAPAGFGKSSLLSEWASSCNRPCLWLSLDQGERNLQQFLAYLLAAVQSVDANLGAHAKALLQATPPPSHDTVLTALLNDVAQHGQALLLVLDDYHLAASEAVDTALTFLIKHLPPQLHVALATREEPALPLARMRVQGQLTELRQQDLRFGREETTAFLNNTMALKLSAAHIERLALRTEGWVAGLQLAAISLQDNLEPEKFIQSFTGSHRFLQDFLLEEVLNRQPPAVQAFLLRTSVLDRMCGELCDAVLLDNTGQSTLEYLEQANLFIIPLDTERRWFRYHHLFAELLRQRLGWHEQAPILLIRASEWYESQGLGIDAFAQAVAANDIDRAIRLIEGDGMPLYFRGGMAPIIQWLQNQPNSLLDRYPSLWVTLAWSLMISGYPNQMAVKLQGAETALQSCAEEANSQDLRGQIAVLKAWIAVAKHDVPSIHTEVIQAFSLLHLHNRAARTAAHCAQGVGYQFAGNRTAAKKAYEQVLSAGLTTGNFMFAVVASMGLGSLQLADNQLHLAAKTYRDTLRKITDPTHLVACEAHLGLARICYEWNDLDAAESHARLSSELARPMESGVGLSADGLSARVMQLRNLSTDANALLAQAAVAAQTRRFTSRLEEIAGIQALDLLRRDEIAAALELAQRHQLPLVTAKALLAQGNAVQALTVLVAYRAQMEQTNRADESLKVMVAQAAVLHALGKLDNALQVLRDALLLGEPGGFIRTFVDEGPAIATLLSMLSESGFLPDYTAQLLLACSTPQPSPVDSDLLRSLGIESLSQRELDILILIKQGNSNQEISDTLFLSLSTVKWHNQNIFDKLHVKRRTEAVARAISLNLLAP